MQIRNALIAVFTVGTMLFTSTASANDLSVLDPEPSSPGRIVEDAAGNAYVSWTHRSSSALADPVMFCRIPAGAVRCTEPIALPIPGAGDNTDAVSGAFPSLGEGTRVAVAAPRYADQSLITWSSFNGGLTFTPGTVNPEAYPRSTDPGGVISGYGQFFFVAASNPGLGFGYAFTPLKSFGNFQFSSPGVGVGTSSLGLEGLSNMVLAYWTVGEPYKMSFYRTANETGAVAPESAWEGPLAIGSGYETKLASDAGRLFLVSQDYAGGPKPTRITVRKYLGTKFGPPATVAEDASVDLFSGGAIAVSPAGEVAVAWPSPGAGGPRVMRLFTSNGGGTAFSGETQIGRIGNGYRAGDNAQMTVGENGVGWLTYLDAGGLHLADLNPLLPLATGTAAAPKPKRYKGKRKTIAKRAGPFEITLRLPQECVLSEQSFSAEVGERARLGSGKRSGGGLRLKKATLFYEGRKIGASKKRLFRSIVDPGVLSPKSTHAVTAKVTATLTGKAKRTINRVLVGRFRGC